MSDWKVHPHRPLVQVLPGLWSLTGSLPTLPLPRNMVLWRLGDGRIVVHSAVCVDDARLSEIQALGPLAFLLVPNQGHRQDAPAWKSRFPDIVVISPRNARAKVQEVIPVEAHCEDVLPPLGVACLVPPGFKEGYELVYDVPVDGGRALVINDVLANGEKFPGFKGMMLGLFGVPGGGFGRARIVNLSFGKNRGAFRPFVEQLAARTDLVAMTVSHGPPIVGAEAVRAALAHAASRL
ncbi:MAG: hypothetical protein H0V89_12120 [Deltaproteobacteria bacterium]|nr:hypothetical protein [Deltaproteobacteria bacterium]